MGGVQLPLYVASWCWIVVLHCAGRHGHCLLHLFISSIMVLEYCILLYLEPW